MGESFYLGVDSGGTKTEVAILAADGSLLSSAIGLPIHLDAVPAEHHINGLRDLCHFACEQAGVRLAEAAYYGLGMCGVDYPDELEAQRRVLFAGLGIDPARAKLANDGIVALWGGSAEAPAVIMQLGTAFTAAYRCEFGNETPFDNLNAGVQFDIRRHLLTTLARMIDGRVKKTALADMVMDYFGETDSWQLIKKVMRGQLEQMQLLNIIAVLKEAVEQEDPVALQLVHDAADYYSRDLNFIIEKRVGFESTDVVLGGGQLFNGPALLSELITDKVKAVHPDVNVHSPLLSPAIGGAVMAAFYANADHHGIFQKALETSE